MDVLNYTPPKAGRITPIGPVFRLPQNKLKGKRKTRRICVAQCECGTILTYEEDRLHDYSVCGPRCPLKRQKQPGPTSRPLYNTWNSIRYRCFNPKCPAFQSYGGRGIGMCDEWRHSFEAFESWAIHNGWSVGLQLDRRDNDGNYEPSNCRFVTCKVNNRNRRSNRLVAALGETKAIAAWCDDSRCVVSPTILAQRIRDGWDAVLAITTPKMATRKRS